jgi:hypothetical protein
LKFEEVMFLTHTLVGTAAVILIVATIAGKPIASVLVVCWLSGTAETEVIRSRRMRLVLTFFRNTTRVGSIHVGILGLFSARGVFFCFTFVFPAVFSFFSFRVWFRRKSSSSISFS